jgi:hypothetical protein
MHMARALAEQQRLAPLMRATAADWRRDLGKAFDATVAANLSVASNRKYNREASGHWHASHRGRDRRSAGVVVGGVGGGALVSSANKS